MFTDENLKQLEEWSERPGRFQYSRDAVKAIFVRLKAAERVVSAITKIRDLNFSEDWRKHNKEIVEAYEAWLKSCGREAR